MGGVYILISEEHCRKKKFRTFLHLTLIGKILMMSQFSDFVVCSTNLYIKKCPDLRPKSLSAVEVTMNVDWTCMNVNRKDVHA